MSQSYEKIGEIRETITLQVSARGCGLCLYLPKQLCETYGVIAGHRLKVMIRDHFRPKIMEEPSHDHTDPPNCVTDRMKRHNKSGRKRDNSGEPDDLS